MSKKPKGFTLTETLIATVVVGILAAIAIPSYSYYVNATQVSESFRLMDAKRINISQMHRNNSCTTVAGTPDVFKGKYGVMTVTGTYTPSQGASCPSGCNVTYTYNNTGLSNKIAGTVVAAQILNNGKLSKLAGSTNVPSRFLPDTFKTIGVTSGDVCNKLTDDPLVPTNGTTPSGTATGETQPPPSSSGSTGDSTGTGGNNSGSNSGGTNTGNNDSSTGTGGNNSGSTGGAVITDLIKFAGAYITYANYRGYGPIRENENPSANAEEPDPCQVGKRSTVSKSTDGFYDVVVTDTALYNSILADQGNVNKKWTISPLSNSADNVGWNIRRTPVANKIEIIIATYMPIDAVNTRLYTNEGDSYCRWVDTTDNKLTLYYEGKEIGFSYATYFGQDQPL